MKHLLLKTITVPVFSLLAFIPLNSKGQCPCQDGLAPTPLEYTVVLNPTNASNNIISFPKFNPTLGTLNCIRLNDTLSIVSRLGIRNVDPDPTEYEFRLTVSTTVSGPGLSRNNFVDTYYGPDLLGSFGTPTDSINYGPDTVYRDYPSVKNTSNVVSYLGATGNVNFTYTIGGGAISMAGGTNFNQSLRTTTWGVFKLTYFWCDNSLLASNITGFSAVQKDKTVKLSWSVKNEETTNSYEILVSRDGRTFTSIGKAAAEQIINGGADYNYNYSHNQATGKLYFRIKQTDGTGKSTFSTIRTVNLDEKGGGTFGIYPNPVVKNVSLQFDRELKGNYKIEVVNLLGQPIYSRTMQLNSQSVIKLDLNNQPASGVYHVRVKSTETGQVFTNKLVIQR